jgi:hypothetical protein
MGGRILLHRQSTPLKIPMVNPESSRHLKKKLVYRYCSELVERLALHVNPTFVSLAE